MDVRETKHRAKLWEKRMTVLMASVGVTCIRVYSSLCGHLKLVDMYTQVSGLKVCISMRFDDNVASGKKI